MKITAFLLVACIMTVSGTTLAQKVTLNDRNASLLTVLQQVKQQSGYDFVIDQSLLEKAGAVTIKFKDADLTDVLDKVFENQQLSYSIADKVITIKEKQPSLLDKLKSALNLDKIDHK